MRKVYFAILTIIYLSISTGIGVNVYYCMGQKVASVFGTASTKTSCNLCKKPGANKSCCATEHHFYKIADAHEPAGKLFIDGSHVIPTAPPLVPNYIFFTEPNYSFAVYNASPPGEKRYKRNCVYRI